MTWLCQTCQAAMSDASDSIGESVVSNGIKQYGTKAIGVLRNYVISLVISVLLDLLCVCRERCPMTGKISSRGR